MQYLKQIIVVGVLLVGFVYTAAPVVNELGEEELGGFIDALINKTINSLLASLNETIAVDYEGLNFTDPNLSGEAEISELKLTGLKELVATQLDVTVATLALNATIVIPEIQLSTKYDANVLLAQLVPLYGKGRIGVTLDDIELHLGGKVSISPLEISNVSITVTLSDAVFDLHGLLNNEDFSTLVSQVLNDNVVPFLNDYKEVIGNIISPIAQQIINSLFGAKSMEVYELNNFLEEIVLTNNQ